MGTDSMFGHILGSHFGVNGLTPMTLTVRVQCPSGYATNDIVFIIFDATASTIAGQP